MRSSRSPGATPRSSACATSSRARARRSIALCATAECARSAPLRGHHARPQGGLVSPSDLESHMALLQGKVAIVTGSGGGIGREHALLFAREGAKVVVNDLGSDRHGGGRGGEMADKVVAEIKGAGGDAVANYDSVATREGADGLIWSALNKFGRLDVVVNNAGILRDKTILNMSEQDFDLVIEVPLRGTFLVTQAAARLFKLQGKGGRIVNTTSLSGLLGNFGQGNYSAAKAGVYGLTRTCSIEFAKFGVTVNAVAPEALTRMTEDLPILKGMTAEDVGPQFISPAVLFLASDLAADVTGEVIGVRGPKLF